MKPHFLFIVIVLLSAFPARVQAPPSQAPAGFTPVDCPFENLSRYTIDCGYLPVPADHAHPDGPAIQLAIAIVRSPNPNKAPDPVLYLQGGPGGEMVTLAPYLVSLGVFSMLLLDRDVIMVDQRGIGLSKPALTCATYQSGAEILTLSQEAVLARLAGCPGQLAERGIDWRLFTSEQNAADLAMVGPALGYEQVNLFGVSYGTLLGLLILRDHPEVVRSAVLDSVLPPGVSAFAESARWLEHSFGLIEAHCQADLLCRLAYPNLRQTMLATYERLKAQPASIEANGQVVPVTATYFAQHAAFAAGRQDIEMLPAFVTAIAHDDYEVTRTFLEAVLRAGQGDMPNQALFISMGCPYFAATTSPEGIAAASAGYAEPFQIARFGVETWQLCQAWGALPSASQELPRTGLPVLLMGGEYDPATPPAWARYAAQGLSRATVVEIPYTSHNVTGVGGAAEECTLQMVTRFYADPSAPVDTTCLAKIPPPAFALHTTVTRASVGWVTLPLGLAAVFNLGWALNSWRKKPGWAAWRAAFRHMGWMPLLSLGVVAGFSVWVAPGQEEDFLKMGAVTAFVPLLMALQAAGAFSPEDEPALEIAMAAPRPLAWLVVERLAALVVTYALIALLGSVVFLLRFGEPLAGQSLGVMLLAWAAPALFLSGVGFYVSTRTRMTAFGVVIVLALWVAFGLFGRFFLPGIPVPFPLNLIQPFLWPIHILATPLDLVPSDFWLNRLFQASAGITLVWAAVRTLSDSEGVLLNARGRKRTGPAAGSGPTDPAPVARKRSFTPLPVRPQALAQIMGIARYEFRMAWRQRTLRVFVVTPIMLFFALVAVNIMESMLAPAVMKLLPPDQIRVIHGEFLVSMSASFLISLGLWMYPLLVAGQVPSDQRTGVAELLRALPMGDSTYLAGKVLGAALAGGAAVLIAGMVYGAVWLLRVGPFYSVPLLSTLVLCLLLLAVASAQAVLLGATQATTQRALALVVLVLIVPEFLQTIPLFQALLPGTTEFLNQSLSTSLESMRFLPPLRRGFDPLAGPLAGRYAGLLLKTAGIALAVWTWRRLKRPAL